jgi:hypothetical protein
MTNRRRQEPTEKAPRQPRGANAGSAESPDVCELLLAELRARRVRLRKLLRLVHMEAERLPAGRAPLRPRARCGGVRTGHVA